MTYSDILYSEITETVREREVGLITDSDTVHGKLYTRYTARQRLRSSSTPAFLVNVDARRPADTPFYRR